jgi:hypothetical protein
VAECDRAVAGQYVLTPQQLFGWSRDVRSQADEASGDETAFARVIVESGTASSPAGRKSRPIEIVIRLGDGSPAATRFIFVRPLVHRFIAGNSRVRYRRPRRD